MAKGRTEVLQPGERMRSGYAGLWAPPQASVLWMVLREVLILLGAGPAANIPCAYLLSRYISAELFGVTPTDIWTGVIAILVLAMVAAIAGLVPARRASWIDPIQAIRYE